MKRYRSVFTETLVTFCTCSIIPFTPHSNAISSVLTLHIFVTIARMCVCTLLVSFFMCVFAFPGVMAMSRERVGLVASHPGAPLEL